MAVTETYWHPNDSVLWAQVSNLVFGISLLVWGVGPALMQRVIGSQSPTATHLLVECISLITGSVFVALYLLVRRRVRWAVWAAFVLALLMTVVGFTGAVVTAQSASLFIPVLAAVAAFANWLGIDTLYRQPAKARPFIRERAARG